LPDQADDLPARLVAMDGLALLYPETFRMLLLVAREALRPEDIEARLEGHSADRPPHAGIHDHLDLHPPLQ
jgi:hypothetical protein